jgi:hypothetical protein
MCAGEVVASAVIAGAFMALAAELGRALGISRSSLILTDGEFAVRIIGRSGGRVMSSVAGTTIHLGTSAVFGAVYYGIARGLDLTPYSAKVIAPYVFVLWLAMLFTALPAAGQGILGRKAGRLAWVEQMGFHAVFGVSFWWALQTL